MYFVPAFTGLAAPYWDPYARAAIMGLTRGASRNHVIRAALESIAYQICDVISLMEDDSGIKAREIRVDGGAARNNFLMQLQADLLDVPVVRPTIVESTARGAASLAGLAVGFWADRAELGQVVPGRTGLHARHGPGAPSEHVRRLAEGRQSRPRLGRPLIPKSATTPNPSARSAVMQRLQPALIPTMYFIGVTTGSSSIMRVFPRWADHLGIEAAITGIDLPLDASPEAYREVVDFIKHDPKSLGALVTTHKLNLFKASRDLFDGVGEDTRLLDEVSSISKRGTELWGHAMDPLTSGLSLLAIVGEDYWGNGEQLILLGAGGSSLALTLYLHRRQVAGAAGAESPGGDQSARAAAGRDARDPRRDRLPDPDRLRAGPDPRHQRRGRRGRLGGLGCGQRNRPRQGPAGLTADRRRQIPDRGDRLGLQLPRRPGLPRPGARSQADRRG